MPLLLASLDNIKIVFISAGGEHTLATTDVGRLYSWGMNYNSQLSQGDRTDRSKPTLIAEDFDLAGEHVVLTSSSNFTNRTVTKSNKINQWGWGKNWQLGLSDILDRLSPEQG